MDSTYFFKDISKRERACFETGIKLGALYHILCGIPISREEKVVAAIEKGIESAISCQPYVKSININLDRKKIQGVKENEFDYDEISGKVIGAVLEIEFENIYIKAKVKWIEEMNYPLMFIESIKEIN